MIVHGPALTVNLSDEPVEVVIIGEGEACPNPECSHYGEERLIVGIVQDTGEMTDLILTEEALLKLIVAGHEWAMGKVPEKLMDAFGTAG